MFRTPACLPQLEFNGRLIPYLRIPLGESPCDSRGGKSIGPCIMSVCQGVPIVGGNSIELPATPAISVKPPVHDERVDDIGAAEQHPVTTGLGQNEGPVEGRVVNDQGNTCLLYTSPSPRD